MSASVGEELSLFEVALRGECAPLLEARDTLSPMEATRWKQPDRQGAEEALGQVNGGCSWL
ncbi:MAG: hypothetical protein AAGF12_43130 [Myxococcota bacterium]